MVFSFTFTYDSTLDNYGVYGFTGNKPSTMSFDTADFLSTYNYLLFYKKNVTDCNYMGKTLNVTVTGKKYNSNVNQQITFTVNWNNSGSTLSFARVNNDSTYGTGVRVGNTTENVFKEITNISLSLTDNSNPATDTGITPTFNLSNVYLINWRETLCNPNLNSASGLYFKYEGEFNSLYADYGNGTINALNRNVFTDSGIENIKLISVSNNILSTLQSISIVGSSTPIPTTTIQIENQLVNASANTLLFDTLSVNDFVINPTVNYHFTTPPILRLTENDVTTDYNFSLDDSGYVLTIDGTLHPDTTNAVFIGSAVYNYKSMTNNLQNATINSLLFNIIDNNTFTISANAGYNFNQPPYIEIIKNGVSTELPFTLSEGVYSLTVDGTLYADSDSISVNGIAGVIPKNITLPLHCSFTNDSDTYIDNVKTSYTLKVKIDTGYYMSSQYMKYHYQEEGYLSDEYFTYDNVNDLYICTFNVYNPQAYFNRQTGNLPYISADIEQLNELIENYGAIRAYKVSKNIAKSLVNKRFYNVNTHEYEDLGVYITSYVRYPFAISTIGSETVKYGFFDTQIDAPIAEKQVYSLSLGKVQLNGLYQNASDINNVKISVILPYTDIYTLDSRFINTEIEFVYKVDILSNTAVIEVYSDNKLVDSLSTSIGYAIPYILRTDRVTPININLQSNILKNNSPKIILKQKAKISGSHYQTFKRMMITGFTGFVRCNNVELSVNDNMTLSEQNALIDALQNGVIVL